MRRRVIAVALVVYFASYAVLSSRGEYVSYNQGGQDNRRGWAPAFCARKAQEITPAGGLGRAKLEFTPLGWLFLPLMLVDQRLIHPAIDEV